MARHPQEQRSRPPTRVFGWLAAVVAPMAVLAGFANASVSRPAEVVTEYRTVAPADEVAELASERARLNRVKRKLNGVKDRLERRRAALAAREAALDRRERPPATGSEPPQR